MLETYLKPIFAFAAGRTDNSNEADELAQEIMFQAVTALSKPRSIHNPNAFIWSIAHNTYKRWLNGKRRDTKAQVGLSDTFGNIMKPMGTFDPESEGSENAYLLRRELSLLTQNHRKALVHHYYDGLSCEQTAREMGISAEMVKFYLSNGRKKVKEGMGLVREYGEKSFNPSLFSIYKSGWSTINIWPLFNRKLPGNIVLAAHDKPLDIPAISLETGVPAVFLEDEIRILADSGLMKEVVKGKYQTAFFIADDELIKRIRELTDATVSRCVEGTEEAYRKVLPTMQSMGFFKREVPEIRYKWLFMQHQNIFDIRFSTDYPRILSDGSSNFIWGEEAERPGWSGGRTPYEGADHAVIAIDISLLGVRHQESLRYKGATLADLARGIASESKTEEYANLVRDGYAVRIGDLIHPNIPVGTTAVYDSLHSAINEATQELKESINIEGLLNDLEKAIKPRMTRLTQGTPRDYASLILSIHIESDLFDAMHSKGYLELPQAGDNTPLTSYLELR